MGGGALAVLAWTGAVAGVGVLRLAWAQPRRSAALNLMGWGILLLAMVAAAQADGAWGVAVATMFAMGAALLLLAVAAWRSPAGQAKAPARRANMLPEAGEPKRIGRRVGTFLLVGVLALPVSIAVALAARGLGILAGWSEADANAAALFASPLVWGVLAYLVLMQERRRAQLLVLLVACLLAAPALALGVVA